MFEFIFGLIGGIIELVVGLIGGIFGLIAGLFGATCGCLVTGLVLALVAAPILLLALIFI